MNLYTSCIYPVYDGYIITYISLAPSCILRGGAAAEGDAAKRGGGGAGGGRRKRLYTATPDYTKPRQTKKSPKKTTLRPKILDTTQQMLDEYMQKIKNSSNKY